MVSIVFLQMYHLYFFKCINCISALCQLYFSKCISCISPLCQLHLSKCIKYISPQCQLYLSNCIIFPAVSIVFFQMYQLYFSLLMVQWAGGQLCELVRCILGWVNDGSCHSRAPPLAAPTPDCAPDRNCWWKCHQIVYQVVPDCTRLYQVVPNCSTGEHQTETILAPLLVENVTNNCFWQLSSWGLSDLWPMKMYAAVLFSDISESSHQEQDHPHQSNGDSGETIPKNVLHCSAVNCCQLCQPYIAWKVSKSTRGLQSLSPIHQMRVSSIWETTLNQAQTLLGRRFWTYWCWPRSSTGTTCITSRHDRADPRRRVGQKVSSLTIWIQVVSHHWCLTLSSNSPP